MLTSCSSTSSITLSPSETIVQEYALIQAGRIDDAAELNSSESMTEKANIAGLTVTIKDAGGLEIKILKENIIGEVATVLCDFQFKNGRESQIEFTLAKENGTWLISRSKLILRIS
jgi:hypothetical protein